MIAASIQFIFANDIKITYLHFSSIQEQYCPSSPEGNVGPENFFQKLFFWSPLTMKIAFPKSDQILLGRNGHFKIIG
jgi:hypothetical protein